MSNNLNASTTYASLKAELQQVMSTFPTAYKVADGQKLSSSENFAAWKILVERRLSLCGFGLLDYFTSGVIVPIDGLSEEEEVRLKTMYDSVIHTVLITMVDFKVLNNTSPAYGFQLAEKLRLRFGTTTTRDLFELFDRLFAKQSIEEDAEKLINFQANTLQYLSDPDMLMGLWLLELHPNPRAEDLILNQSDKIDIYSVQKVLMDVANGESDSVALVATSNSSSKKKKKRGSKVVCYRCQEPGYVASKCTAPAPVAPDKANEPQSVVAKAWTAVALNASETAVSDSVHYWFDSGADKHICNNSAHFSNLRSMKGELLGIGSTPLKIEGVGDIMLGSPHDQDRVVLQNVLYVPKCARNLISIKCSTSRGIKVTFTEHSVYYDNVKVGSMFRGLLYRSYYVPIVQGIGLAAITKSSSDSLHAKMGHPSDAVLKRLYPDVFPTICDSCSVGRAVKTIPKQSVTSTTHPLELIHADICGPFSISGLNNERYFLTVVDDYTHFTKIYPLTHKSQAPTIMISYIKQAETHFSSSGFKLRNLKTDNGTEFVNHHLDQFLLQLGVNHQPIVPYNSYQNGVAKRMNRTIQEKIRVLLSSSALPLDFWNLAASMAEFLVNRLPSSAINFEVPFARWNGYSPNYDVFYPFGCRCFTLVPPELRLSKLHPTAEPCVFVGYPTNQKAFLVYNVTHNRIFVSNQVTFSAHEFPYKISDSSEVKSLDVTSLPV